MGGFLSMVGSLGHPGYRYRTKPWQAMQDHARTVRIRDKPVELSDSCSETHQHWSPVDANCCYSLPLDPDAPIAIGLRKRLFLLVSRRGEWPRISLPWMRYAD
jgi:hypothetical protein